MSISSIFNNQQILNNLSTALNLISPTTGITVLNSGNNNIETEVVGNTGTITLAAELENLSLVSTTLLEVDTFVNPFTLNQPAADGYVLSSTTGGALSWVAQTGGGGGISSIQTTDANLTAAATGDPAVWEIGLNQDVNGLTSLFANTLSCGDGTNTTGLNIVAGSGGLDMGNCPIINAAMSNPFKVAPSSDGQVLSSTTGGVLSWVAQGGGGGGITTINTTNTNLTAAATGDPAVWEIGLNPITTGLTSLESEILYCGTNSLVSGLQVSVGSGGIFMNGTAIQNATMTNPFNVAPSSDGQVLSSTTGGVLSWVAQGGGGGGITTIQTTNTNLTADATADPAIWTIGLNTIVDGLVSLVSEQISCGVDGSPDTGLNVVAGSGGIFMNAAQIGQVNYIGNLSTDPSTSVDIFSDWNQGANQWGGEVYLDNTGVYIDTNSSTKNLYYSPSGDLANYSTAVSYPPTTTPTWAITNGGDATLATGVFTAADANETAVKLNAGNLDMGNNEIINVNQIVAYSTAPSPDIKVRSNVDTGAGTFGGELYMDSTGVYLTTNSEANKIWLDNSGNLSGFNTATPFPPISTPQWSIGGVGQAEFSNIQTTGTGISINNGGVLLTNNMVNPFSVQPTVSGQVLSCSTAGNLTWVGNGSGSTTGSLVSLGGAYTALALQTNSPFVYILPTTSFNGLAVAGMVYYINLSNFVILNNGGADNLTVGIYLNGSDPTVGGAAASLQTFYTTGSYTTISAILQYTIQSPADTFAIYVGALGASISTVTGGSYTITGVIP